MSNPNWSDIEVGNYIKVKTWNRYGRKTVVRKVTEVHDAMGVGIRMFGWNPFWLSPSRDELIEIYKEKP